MAVPEHPRSAGDTLATVVIGVLAVLAAVVSVGISPFFVMTTDACGPDNCHLSLLTLAYVVTWGGIAVAALVGVIGAVRAARRGPRTWVWAATALAIVVASFGIGALLAVAVMPN